MSHKELADEAITAWRIHWHVLCAYRRDWRLAGWWLMLIDAWSVLAWEELRPFCPCEKSLYSWSSELGHPKSMAVWWSHSEYAYRIQPIYDLSQWGTNVASKTVWFPQSSCAWIMTINSSFTQCGKSMIHRLNHCNLMQMLAFMCRHSIVCEEWIPTIIIASLNLLRNL